MGNLVPGPSLDTLSCPNSERTLSRLSYRFSALLKLNTKDILSLRKKKDEKRWNKCLAMLNWVADIWHSISEHSSFSAPVLAQIWDSFWKKRSSTSKIKIIFRKNNYYFFFYCGLGRVIVLFLLIELLFKKYFLWFVAVSRDLNAHSILSMDLPLLITSSTPGRRELRCKRRWGVTSKVWVSGRQSLLTSW